MFQLVNYVIDAFLVGKGVPIFFFISGLLFFYNIDFSKEVYLKKLKKRVRSLLVPYIIWNLLVIIEMAILRLPCISSLSPNIKPLNLTFWGIISCFWDCNPGLTTPDVVTEMTYVAPINGPLWFMRELMKMVIIAPLLYYMLKKLKVWFVLLLGAASFYNSFLTYSQFGGTTLTALLFFSWGAYISIFKVNIVQIWSKYMNLSLLLFIVTGIMGLATIYLFPDWMPVVRSLGILVGPFFAYNLSVWLLKRDYCKVNKFLSSSSFFIYVSHSLIFPQIVKASILLVKSTNSDWVFLIAFTLDTIIIVSSLLVAFYLLNRYAKPVLNVLTGRE